MQQNKHTNTQSKTIMEKDQVFRFYKKTVGRQNRPKKREEDNTETERKNKNRSKDRNSWKNKQKQRQR